MSRIEITTLNATLTEPDVHEDECGGFDSETVDIVVRFGDALVARWSVEAPYCRYPEDRRRFLEEAVADRLRPLFEKETAA